MGLSYLNGVMRLALKEAALANQDTIIKYDSIKYDFRDSSVVIYDHVNDSLLYFGDTIVLDPESRYYDLMVFDTTQFITPIDSTWISEDGCQEKYIDVEDREAPIRDLNVTYLECYEQFDALWAYQGTFKTHQNGGIDTTDGELDIELSEFLINQMQSLGELKIENAGITSGDDSNLLVHVTMNESAFLYNGVNFSMGVDLTYERRSGAATPYQALDDVWRITGVFQGTSSDGQYFQVKISDKQPLLYNSGCNWIGSGKMQLDVYKSPDYTENSIDRIPRSINFGKAGTCNNTATVSIKKRTQHLLIQ